MKYTYLFIDLCSVLVPFLFSFHPKLKFHKTWKAFWPACIITSAFFIGWDVYFTNEKVWGFNPKYLTGIQIFNLPFEEVLFFIFIPYSCVFTYHCLNLLIKKQWTPSFTRSFTAVLFSILLSTAIVFIKHRYTSVTFFLLSIFLLFFFFGKLPDWLGKFYFAWIILLIPFFIVNGILTGTGPDEPIVWYNNAENLSVRAFTIPIEDFFYGMLLLLMNVYIYETLKKRFSIV